MVTLQKVRLAEVLSTEKFNHRDTWYYFFHVVSGKGIVFAVPENGGQVKRFHKDTYVYVERPVISAETVSVRKSVKDVIKSIIKECK